MNIKMSVGLAVYFSELKWQCVEQAVRARSRTGVHTHAYTDAAFQRAYFHFPQAPSVCRLLLFICFYLYYFVLALSAF